jgi:hypothetical protein
VDVLEVRVEGGLPDGIQEVDGSIPFSSTSSSRHADSLTPLLLEVTVGSILFSSTNTSPLQLALTRSTAAGSRGARLLPRLLRETPRAAS